MKRMLSAAVILLLSVSPAMASGLQDFLNQVNIQARTDLHHFTTQVSAQFGVPEAQVRVVLQQVSSPADAFMVFQLGQMANQQPEAVMRVYQASRDRGWGVMAKQLGIRPGSPEFHALKRGELQFGPDGQVYGQGAEPGNAGGGGPPGLQGNPGHGRGHGKGRGRD